MLCALVIAPRARADSAAALELATRATRAAQAGDRRGAIELLEQAYAVDAQGDYLLQIAQLYEALATQGDARDVRLAIAHYQLALASERNAVEIQAIEERLRQLRELLHPQKAQSLAAPPTGVGKPADTASSPAPEKAVQDVHIAFAPEVAGEKYTVAYEDQICEAPCALRLKPGWRIVTLTSPGDERKVSLSVPETTGSVRLPATRRSFFVAGLTLTIVGAAVAATFWAIFQTPCDGAPTCVTANQTVWPIVGGGLVIGGVSLLAYHQARDLGLTVEAQDGEKPAVRVSSIGLQPLRNGAAAGVRFSF